MIVFIIHVCILYSSKFPIFSHHFSDMLVTKQMVKSYWLFVLDNGVGDQGAPCPREIGITTVAINVG